jgi:hypothetical protein
MADVISGNGRETKRTEKMSGISAWRIKSPSVFLCAVGREALPFKGTKARPHSSKVVMLACFINIIAVSIIFFVIANHSEGDACTCVGKGSCPSCLY